MTGLATNVLHYGDNLDILRRYLPETCVDLVYLDPPFNSNRDYNADAEPIDLCKGPDPGAPEPID